MYCFVKIVQPYYVLLRNLGSLPNVSYKLFINHHLPFSKNHYLGLFQVLQSLRCFGSTEQNPNSRFLNAGWVPCIFTCIRLAWSFSSKDHHLLIVYNYLAEPYVTNRFISSSAIKPFTTGLIEKFSYWISILIITGSLGTQVKTFHSKTCYVGIKQCVLQAL